MKISYCSLGCKVNLYESVAIVNQFVDNGFTVVDFNEESDVYIINTCSVTATSDAKSRKMIRQAKRRNKNSIIAVMGCYSQLNPEEVQNIGADIILGTSNRHLLFSLVMKELSNRQEIIMVDDYREIRGYEELKLERYDNKSRGFVKIQDGCNNFCSYCTIPYARGPIRSRNADDVVKEIQILTDSGMKEIVLTGINTGTYGKDLHNFTFEKLLEKIIKEVNNLGRLRISSIETTEVTTELLQLISENKAHFCMHLHIPIQGGSDNTLKRMNRKYNIEEYKAKISEVRKYLPNINITTDIMAGFCGETFEDFKDTIELVKELNYGEMHVFPYSRRPKTKAYNMENHIDEITKRYRVNELLTVNKNKALEYRNKFIGEVLEVIVERIKGNKGFGHSSNYLEVEFVVRAQTKVHDLVKLKIEKAGYPISLGEIVEENNEF